MNKIMKPLECESLFKNFMETGAIELWDLQKSHFQLELGWSVVADFIWVWNQNPRQEIHNQAIKSSDTNMVMQKLSHVIQQEQVINERKFNIPGSWSNCIKIRT